MSLGILALLLATATALAATGSLTQPSGTAGCVSQTGDGPCADGHGLTGPHEVAVSPDGKSVYVAAFNNNGVALLTRNTANGALSQPGGSGGCISNLGKGPCTVGHGLAGVQSVAVSADGKNVYAATYSNAVVRLDRNTATGALSQPGGSAGCISQTGAGPCAHGHGLKYPVSVAVSADGKSVYVTAVGADDVARFNRNTATGAISQPGGSAGCVSETGSGPCATGHGLVNPAAVAVSPDGKSAYVAARGSNAIVRFDRSTTTGAITQPAGTAGCISIDGAGGECAVAPPIQGPGFTLPHAGYNLPASVAVSPDGKSVYLAGDGGGAVAILVRNTATGALTQPAGVPGCILQNAMSAQEKCANAHGLASPVSLAVSADGKSVYVAVRNAPGVVSMNRNATTGALTQDPGTGGCVTATGSGTCRKGHALTGPTGVAVSSDGKSVYLAAFGSDAVARFNRAP